MIVNWPRPDKRPKSRTPLELAEGRRLIGRCLRGSFPVGEVIDGYPFGFNGNPRPSRNHVPCNVLNHSIEDRIQESLWRRSYNHFDTTLYTFLYGGCRPIGEGATKPRLLGKEKVFSSRQSRQVYLPSGNLKAHHTIHDKAYHLATKSSQPIEHLC